MIERSSAGAKACSRPTSTRRRTAPAYSTNTSKASPRSSGRTTAAIPKPTAPTARSASAYFMQPAAPAAARRAARRARRSRRPSSASRPRACSNFARSYRSGQATGRCPAHVQLRQHPAKVLDRGLGWNPRHAVAPRTSAPSARTRRSPPCADPARGAGRRASRRAPAPSDRERLVAAARRVGPGQVPGRAGTGQPRRAGTMPAPTVADFQWKFVLAGPGSWCGFWAPRTPPLAGARAASRGTCRAGSSRRDSARGWPGSRSARRAADRPDPVLLALLRPARGSLDDRVDEPGDRPEPERHERAAHVVPELCERCLARDPPPPHERPFVPSATTTSSPATIATATAG